MNKFKVGDVVRRTAGSYANMLPGDIATVERVFSDIDFKLKGYEGIHYARFFELVEDTAKYHKHHDVIVAWAKGAKVQFKEDRYSSWTDCVGNPIFLKHVQYRIKPANTDEIQSILKELDKLSARLKELEG